MKIKTLTKNDYLCFLIDVHGFSMNELKDLNNQELKKFASDYGYTYLDVYNFTY